MVYLMILQRNSISSVVFLPKIPLQEESSEKPKLRNILQSNQSVFLKNVKVMKQILKNSVYRGDENANCGPWLDPGPEIEIVFGTKEIIKTIQSAQFSHSILSDSLRLHESQHARPPCPSPTPGVHPNSCASSRWCHLAISSSVIPFSSCPQSLPASGSFPMSQFFTWGGQSIGVSASASVLLMNTLDWSPLGWTGWISLQSKGLTILRHSDFFTVQLSHPNMTTRKTIALTRRTFVESNISAF